MNGYIFANYFGGYAKARKFAGFSSLALNSFIYFKNPGCSSSHFI